MNDDDELESLNLDQLDVHELEYRIELATLPLGICSSDNYCHVNNTCNPYSCCACSCNYQGWYCTDDDLIAR